MSRNLCVYICVYIFIRVHSCVLSRMNICIHMCVCVHVCAYGEGCAVHAVYRTRSTHMNES